MDCKLIFRRDTRVGMRMAAQSSNLGKKKKHEEDGEFKANLC